MRFLAYALLTAGPRADPSNRKLLRDGSPGPGEALGAIERRETIKPGVERTFAGGSLRPGGTGGAAGHGGEGGLQRRDEDETGRPVRRSASLCRAASAAHGAEL